MITLVTTRAKGPVGEWIWGKYLEWLKLEGGYKSQAEFARRLGIDRALLNQYLNGRQKPSKANVEKLASLGLEIYDLVDMERPDPNLQRLILAYDAAAPDKKEEIIKYAFRAAGFDLEE